MNSIVIYSMNFNVQKNERSLGKTAKTLVSMIELNIFFLAEIIVGIAWGWFVNGNDQSCQHTTKLLLNNIQAY